MAQYLVEPVPDCYLFDTDEKLDLAKATWLWNVGHRGAIRYVGRSGPAPNDIDAAELSMLLDVGYGVMLVQHAPLEGWQPTAAMGAADGRMAANLAEACGYAEGATLWDDLEEPIKTASPAEVAEYANSKYENLKTFHRPQGEYIGSGLPFDSNALFTKLAASIYWRSLSAVPDVARRGYAMRQFTTIVSGGVEFDANFCRDDRMGARPTWMRKAA